MILDVNENTTKTISTSYHNPTSYKLEQSTNETT